MSTIGIQRVTAVVELVIDYHPVQGRLHQIFQGSTCRIEVALEEHHLGRRGRSADKEIQLLLLSILTFSNQSEFIMLYKKLVFNPPLQ